jgi:hypothetical protein
MYRLQILGTRRSPQGGAFRNLIMLRAEVSVELLVVLKQI